MPNLQTSNHVFEQSGFGPRSAFAQVPQQRHEFVAAKTTPNIRTADMLADGGGDSLERMIAGKVAVPIVDRFKFLEIGKKQRGAGVIALHIGKPAGQRPFEATAIENVQQRIGLDQCFKVFDPDPRGRVRPPIASNAIRKRLTIRRGTLPRSIPCAVSYQSIYLSRGFRLPNAGTAPKRPWSRHANEA